MIRNFLVVRELLLPPEIEAELDIEANYGRAAVRLADEEGGSFAYGGAED